VSARVAVVVFPGSNCEHDVVGVLATLGAAPALVWHEQCDLDGADAVVIPGGFAHGDYLRPGAIARFSPVMAAVDAFARSGGPVLGICNGFQVLTEAGLVPGALRPNEGRRFLCKTVTCTIESATSSLTNGLPVGRSLKLPINHYEGNYTITPDDLARIEANGQIVLRYDENPNGSVAAIAGVSNERGNVVGLMPHPERASNSMLGSDDGLMLLETFLRSTAG
jgi:phosphoribosylformylglycinamidine synthase I